MSDQQTAEAQDLAAMEEAFGLEPSPAPDQSATTMEGGDAAQADVVTDPGVDPEAGDPAADVSNAVAEAAAATEGNATPKADALLNVKAEFERKLALRDAHLQELANKYQALLDVTAKRAEPEPPKQQEPADPFAGLDANDPDYEFHKLRIETNQLRDQLKALVGQTVAEKQAVQQAQSNQQWTEWVQTNTANAVKMAFGDMALPPEVSRQAYALAHASWAATGYEHRDGGAAYTAAVNEARQYAQMVKPLLKQGAAPAVDTRRPVPVPVKSGGASPLASAAATSNPGQPKFTDRDAMIDDLANEFRNLANAR